MWSIFKKKQETPSAPAPSDFSFLGCDFHSHLIPGIDDGAPTLEESLDLIRGMKALGYKKLITTPHVHGDYYKNSRELILSNFKALTNAVEEAGIDIELGVAAEYYLDAYFKSEVLPNDPLTFGDKYLLVEISMMGLPYDLYDLLFAAESAGYRLVLAHPERYAYEKDTSLFRELKERGILLQMNLLSITGYYGRTEKTLAEAMLSEGLYHFCSSDLHHERHLRRLKDMTYDSVLMRRLADYPFANVGLM